MCRYANIILINAESHNSSCGAPRSRSEGDCHQEFYQPFPPSKKINFKKECYLTHDACTLFLAVLLPQYLRIKGAVNACYIVE